MTKSMKASWGGQERCVTPRDRRGWRDEKTGREIWVQRSQRTPLKAALKLGVLEHPCNESAGRAGPQVAPTALRR